MLGFNSGFVLAGAQMGCAGAQGDRDSPRLSLPVSPFPQLLRVQLLCPSLEIISPFPLHAQLLVTHPRAPGTHPRALGDTRPLFPAELSPCPAAGAQSVPTADAASADLPQPFRVV